MTKEKKLCIIVKSEGRCKGQSSDEYTEKYSRGRRGAPAKGVGRLKPAREFKSLLLRQQKQNICLPTNVLFLFIQAAGLSYHRRTTCGVYHQGRRAALVSHHALACIYLRLDDIQCFALMIYRDKLRMIYTPSA